MSKAYTARRTTSPNRTTCPEREERFKYLVVVVGSFAFIGTELVPNTQATSATTQR